MPRTERHESARGAAAESFLLLFTLKTMSLSSPTHQPEILSGPFGSLLNDLHGISTREAFSSKHFEQIRSALHAYRVAGVTQPVTPTFGAAARGVNGGRFSQELEEWNQLAAQFTHEVFPGREPLGSIAPLLDTSGTDDAAWSAKTNRSDAARRIHLPQLQALRDAGIGGALAEAVHDFDEATGIVNAAADAGMQRVIVSFEPTERGLPNNAIDIQSYDEVASRLHDIARGRIQACIGMNCGNADQIIDLLSASKPGTFAAVYPNHSIIPHNETGARFRELADLNHERTDSQELEFDGLRRLFQISDAQLQRLSELGGELGVRYLGLCCGSGPHDVRELAARVRIATPADALQ